MREIREIIHFWERRRAEQLALATLVRAHGSSYRRPGARMLIASNAESVGSLSAGCIEEEVIACAREVIRDHKPQLIGFDTRRRFGCSGSIEIFVEPAPDDALLVLRDRLQARKSCELATVFENGESLRTHILSDHVGTGAFVQTIEPPLRLIVIGEGPDANGLVAQAQLLGWDLELIPSIIERKSTIDHRTAAVIATHNFGRDCAALRHLLPLDLRYVGLVGPRRRREELLLDVIDSGASTKSRLFAPAGLHLAAETPEEIALSIIAEIQAVFGDGTGEHLRDRKAPIHANCFAECAMSAH